jgi:hypothetical protein
MASLGYSSRTSQVFVSEIDAVVASFFKIEVFVSEIEAVVGEIYEVNKLDICEIEYVI